MKITKKDLEFAFKYKKFNPENYEFMQIIGTVFGRTEDKNKLFDEVLSNYPKVDAIYCEEWKGLLTFRILKSTTLDMYDLCKNSHLDNSIQYYNHCIYLYEDGNLQESLMAFKLMVHDEKRKCLTYMAENKKDAYMYFFDLYLQLMNEI